MFLKGWRVNLSIQNAPPSKFQNAWTEHNPSNTIPAVYFCGNYPGVSGYASTYYMNDLSYLKLKNLYLSYSISKKIVDKIKSKGITVCVSGGNLITFTNFEGADLERRIDNTRFTTFPQTRMFIAGLNIKF